MQVDQRRYRFPRDLINVVVVAKSMSMTGGGMIPITHEPIGLETVPLPRLRCQDYAAAKAVLPRLRCLPSANDHTSCMFVTHFTILQRII